MRTPGPSYSLFLKCTRSTLRYSTIGFCNRCVDLKVLYSNKSDLYDDFVKYNQNIIVTIIFVTYNIIWEIIRMSIIQKKKKKIDVSLFRCSQNEINYYYNILNAKSMCIYGNHRQSHKNRH